MHKGLAGILLAALCFADFAAWGEVVRGIPPRETVLSVFDVGQGDAIMVEFRGGTRMLTDAGPDASILRAMESKGFMGGRYVDLGVVTHPELDHFGGFVHLLRAGYRFGVLLINGRDRDKEVGEWRELVEEVRRREIPLIVVGEGDAVHHAGGGVAILAPSLEFLGSAELNDTGVVQKVITPDFTALLAADTGFRTEEYLAGKYELSADILKLGHHGSKFSSGRDFLGAVHPASALVSAGPRNRYGHPAPEIIDELRRADIPLFRTDTQGSVEVRRRGNELEVRTLGK